MTTSAGPLDQPAPPKATSRRTKWLAIPVALGVVHEVRALAARSETTDNATVAADVVPVSPEIAGMVREVLVHEHERVEAGAVLMRLDTAAADAHLARARAELASARVRVEQPTMRAAVADKQVSAGVDVARGDELSATAKKLSLAAQTREAEAAVQAAAARALQTHTELESASKLVDSHSLALIHAEESRTNAAHADAELRRAEAVVARATAEQEVAEGARRAASGKVQASLSGVDVKLAEAEARLAAAQVDEAQAVLDLAEMDRRHAEVVAPAAGRSISVRAGSPGESASRRAIRLMSSPRTSPFSTSWSAKTSSASRRFAPAAAPREGAARGFASDAPASRSRPSSACSFAASAGEFARRSAPRSGVPRYAAAQPGWTYPTLTLAKASDVRVRSTATRSASLAIGASHETHRARPVGARSACGYRAPTFATLFWHAATRRS